jgi:hypothetical protein
MSESEISRTDRVESNGGRSPASALQMDGQNLAKFHVRVGLAECTVMCRTEQEAVRLARVKIGQEMPKVRTVLHNIHDKEFRVDRAD